MKNIHIIMPMGGLGTRTSTVYKTPKPFIKIYDKYLFEYALDGLLPLSRVFPLKVTMIIRNETLGNCYERILNERCWSTKSIDKFNIVKINSLTRGSLETVMCAEELIDDDDICVILDCDLVFKYGKFEDLINNIYEGETYSGFLLSFNSESDKYSYAEVNDDNIVLRTAEKDPISTHALAGVYGFSSGKLLKQYAECILDNPSEYNEYYVSVIYNYMINDGMKIFMGTLDEYVSLGTADEIDEFKDSDNKFKKLFITDFDGTLFDTREANYKAYKETLYNIYNYELNDDDYYNNFGLRINELLDKLGLDISRISDVKKMKSEVYKKYYNDIRINVKLLTELYHNKNNGHIIALATTASKNNIYNILNYFRINDLFDYILTGEDVNNGKPDPEAYNKVIIKYPFIQYHNIYIFEDSDVGLLAAIRSHAINKNIFDINKNSNLNEFITLDELDNIMTPKNIVL